MSDYLRVQYAARPETKVYSQSTGGRVINKILLGTWVGILEEDDGISNKIRVITAGPDGWIKKSDLKDSSGLKIFFIDVGQGDSMLIESMGNRILVDGGPNSNLKRYLKKYQYKFLLKDKKNIHIDIVFVSHFDVDHYRGLTHILNDKEFTFGTIYHNGIARFHEQANLRPSNYNTDLGVMKIMY